MTKPKAAPDRKLGIKSVDRGKIKKVIPKASVT